MRRLLHAIAEAIRNRQEPLKTLLTAVLGLALSSAAGITGNWLTIKLIEEVFLREHSSATIVLLTNFLWTAGSVVLGGYVVARVHCTRATLSAFVVLELFFGSGMVAEFWTSEASFLDALAVVLVIPCALLGAGMRVLRGPWDPPSLSYRPR